MATNVREMPLANQPSSQTDRRFYKVQIKGWVDFDPTDRALSDIVQAIEKGSGVVTAMEVTKVANAMSEIPDPEVRERFTDIAAVNRVVDNFGALPSLLKEKLQRALRGEPHTEQSAR